MLAALLLAAVGPLVVGTFTGRAAATLTTELGEPPRVELPSLRTRTSKTYRNADGTHATEISLGSVHYRDGTGVWRDIKSGLVAASLPTYEWENEANRFRVALKNTLGPDFLRFEVDDRAFALTLPDALPAVGRAAGSAVHYEGVRSGVDLRYDILPDAIKESLILRDASVSNEFTFVLSSKGAGALRAEREPGGGWAFFVGTEADPVFRLAAPIAADAGLGGKRSLGEATLDVTPLGATFLVRLRVDPRWLQAPGRKFPVVLDPTVDFNPAHDGNFVGTCPGCQGIQHHGSGDLWVGGDTVSTWWAAFKFDVSSIPAGADVTMAQLLLLFEYRQCLEVEYPQDRCSAHPMDVHKLTGDWAWWSQTSALNYGGPLDSWTLPFDSLGIWMNWDVTWAAEDWIEWGEPNYGLLVKRNPDNANAGGPMFPGSSWPNPGERPILRVDYNPPPPPPPPPPPNNAPTTPNLISPRDDNGVPDLPTTTPVLSASSTDQDGDAIALLFRVASDAACTQVVKESGWLWTTASWTVPPGFLKDGGEYYWCAQASDGEDASAWALSERFRIRLPKLGLRVYWPIWSHGPVSVNQVTGNLIVSLPGPSYPTAAGSMGASVTHNSLASTTDSGLGPRWILDAGDELGSPPTKLIDHRLFPSNDPRYFDAVERVSGDGSSDFYTHVAGSNTYLSAPGDGSQLSRNADGSWTLLDADGAIYTFSSTATGAEYPLTGIEWAETNVNAAPLNRCYTGTKITSLRDTNCSTTPTRELKFIWNSLDAVNCAAAILCIKGPDNVTWRYVGDGAGGVTGRLVRINNGTRDVAAISYAAGTDRIETIKNANDLNPPSGSPGHDPNISPGYDSRHALEICYEGAARVKDVADSLVVAGQPPCSAASKWSFGYFPGAVSTSPTRNAHGTLPAGTVRTADGSTTLTPPRQQGTANVVRTYYDNVGHPIEARDLLGNITMAAHDEQDRLLWTEDEDGNPTDNQWADVEGNPTTNPLIATALASVTGPDPDGGGPLERPVTRYRYDETRIGEGFPALTTSSNEITDATRSASVQGDGRTSDSSFGLWEGTTNMLPNGGFESNLNSWWWPSDAVGSRDLAPSKFGGARFGLRALVPSGGDPYAGGSGLTLAPSTRYSWSAWVYFPSAAYLPEHRIYLQEKGGAWRAIAQLGSGSVRYQQGWHRISGSATTPADWFGDSMLVLRPARLASGEYDIGLTLSYDGVQVEQKHVATPYVHTDGTTASRAAARVQAPASTITATQGWFAARVRPGWSASTGPGFNPRVASWRPNGSNFIDLCCPASASGG